jgi:Tol biopolymer transport system component
MKLSQAFTRDDDAHSETHHAAVPARIDPLRCAGWGASWSPDGNEIMFITQYGNPPAGFERDIYTIDLNTRVVRRLTQHPASDDNPIWLSDGLTIAFRSDRDYASSAVYLMNSDGENVRRIVYDAPTFTWWP